MTEPPPSDDDYRVILERFDALNREALAQSGVKLACAEGCSLCCWLRVEVFAHEVFLIAQHIQERFSEAARAALQDRLAAHADAVLPLTPFEHATRNVPCPLLQDGRCSIYEVRPLACRRQHSRELAACQYTFEHPDDLEFPGAPDRALFQRLTAAMRAAAAGYAELGYDVTIYELGTALEEALRDPEAWESWRGRLHAFLRASITPAE